MSTAMHGKSFGVGPGWRILLQDLGISPVNVLRRAGLPEDLLSREGAALSSDEYFHFWRGLEEEAADPILPIRIGDAISVEAFDPPIFAAFCSPDLNTALRRLSRYKRLICPMVLNVEERDDGTFVDIQWLETHLQPPVTLAATELIFFVQLARLATRARIRPLRVTTGNPPSPMDAYIEYFGVPVTRDPKHTVTFSAEDAKRPFLTANEGMWRFFEPELRKRLSELDETATISDRVRAALLELLPSGDASMRAISKKLALSTRTLQRRLNAEDTNFQLVLSRTREELARHYLKNSAMPGAEISFLLGFDDPNSFSRAFHSWTGETPEQARVLMRAGA